MRRFGVFWGIVLVVIGGLALAENLGILPPMSWDVLWPLILVALGAWIVMGAFIRPRSSAEEHVSVPIAAARSARFIVKHGAGRLEIGGGAAPNELYGGEFHALRQRVSASGDGAVAELFADEDWARWEFGAHGLDWRVRLTEAVPVALELHVGASENRLDLTRVRLTDLLIETGASSTSVALPANAGFTRVRLKTGAASVALTVPAGVAARVTTRGGLASWDIDEGRFPRLGAVWQSPDWETAANRVEIDAEVGVGSISVR